MIWKPKEKELSPEEAIELAKKELAPYWLGSSPLIAGVKNNDRYLVVPLNPDFVKKSWVILFLDSTIFNGEASLFYVNEWYRRYHLHDLQMLAVIYPGYSYLKSHEPLQLFRDLNDIKFPVVIDVEESIAPAFSAHDLPKIILFDQGNVNFEYTGLNGIKSAELRIQNFLRSRDPGLPLLPILEESETPALTRDTLRIEFGFAPKLGKTANFFPSEFGKTEEKLRVGQFHSTRPEKIPPGKIFINGQWKQDSEKIMTSDSTAMIAFSSMSSRVSIIAQSLRRGPDVGTISVEVDFTPAYESIAGEHMILDDSGRSLVKLHHSQLYHVLVGLGSSSSKEITFRFPNAADAPVAIYGMRFGEEDKR